MGGGGASKVMMGVNHSCVWGCSLLLGVLASMYPIPAGCKISRRCSILTIFLSVFSAGWVAFRVFWLWVGSLVDQLYIMMSMPSGKLARIASGVMVFVLAGSRVSH